ncbi:hypothetical protein [Flavobacterium sp.]|uniref:hypothetical protein n=1 Tax=Flavobacterium sp. TaxID=239 RepID=UPI0037B29F8F
MKSKVKITAITIFSVALLFFVVLVYHIATAKPVVYDNSTMQISRIDFKEPLDTLKMKEIHRDLKSIPGFISDSYNLKKGILVYFHDNRIADSKTIYNALILKGNYKADRYIISKSLASNEVCPVMNKGSLSYKFSKTVKQIFN